MDTIFGFKNFYDHKLNKIKCVYSTGMVEEWEYDILDRVTKYSIFSGNQEPHIISYMYKSNNTVYEFDGKEEIINIYNDSGKLVESNSSSGYFKHYNYNEKGLLESEIDSKGFVVRYEYRNGNSDVSRKYNTVGYEEYYKRDEEGRIISYQNTNGMKKNYQYNDKGQLISEYNYNLNIEKKYNYDNEGKCTKIYDSIGNITTIKYDSEGRCIRKENNYFIKTYSYNEHGLLEEYKRECKQEV